MKIADFPLYRNPDSLVIRHLESGQLCTLITLLRRLWNIPADARELHLELHDHAAKDRWSVDGVTGLGAWVLLVLGHHDYATFYASIPLSAGEPLLHCKKKLYAELYYETKDK